MYRIPKELDLSKAVGEFTTQIRVGKYDIQFEFGDVHFAVQTPKIWRSSSDMGRRKMARKWIH